MRIDRTCIAIAILTLVISAGDAHAQMVTVRTQNLSRHLVIARKLTPHRARPVRHAYGRAVRLGHLVSALGAIHSDRAAAVLDATLLTEAQRLIGAPYHISAQKLSQAKARATRARAKLDSAVAALRSRYGKRFAGSLLNDARMVDRIVHGEVSIVEAIVPYPPLGHPARTATARVDGGPDVAARRIKLTFLGVAGRIPSGMVGQSLYYLAPPLQAGTMLRVTLRLVRHRGLALRVPLSALVFDGAKLIAFRRTAPNTFRSVLLSGARPFYSRGHVAGYQVTWLNRTQVPIVVKGAGLLWSLSGTTAGSR